MNRSLILSAVVLACAGSVAQACTCGTGTHQTGDVCVADSPKSGSKANATASAAQTQGQIQGQAQGQLATGGTSSSNAAGGSASATDASNSGGNSYSTSYDAARIPVSAAFVAAGQTTAGCRFAEGLGVQTMPAGTSVGFSFKDHDCARFQLAQFFYTRGQDIAGDKIMCQIREVSDALGADCPALVHEIQVTQAVYPPGERERRQARAQWDQVQK